MSKVSITVTRTYEYDEAKTAKDFASDIAVDVESGCTHEAAIREAFHELCGFGRDKDHVDGSYVWLLDEHSETEWNA